MTGLLIRGEVRKSLRNLFFSHIFGVALAMEQYKSLCPRNAGLFGTVRVLLLFGL